MQEIKLFKAQHNWKEVIGFEVSQEPTWFYICDKVFEVLMSDRTSVEEVDKILQDMIWKFNNDIKQVALF